MEKGNQTGKMIRLRYIIAILLLIGWAAEVHEANASRSIHLLLAMALVTLSVNISGSVRILKSQKRYRNLE
jgi:uncharacterized membrane protein